MEGEVFVSENSTAIGKKIGWLERKIKGLVVKGIKHGLNGEKICCPRITNYRLKANDYLCIAGTDEAQLRFIEISYPMEIIK